MKGHLIELSEHPYGCRVVQKAIDFISHSIEEQQSFMDEINHEALKLVENSNANHVIQKCFEVLPLNLMEVVIKEIIKDVLFS